MRECVMNTLNTFFFSAAGVFNMWKFAEQFKRNLLLRFLLKCEAAKDVYLQDANVAADKVAERIRRKERTWAWQRDVYLLWKTVSKKKKRITRWEEEGGNYA